jgi:hypothetical protein
VRFAILGVSPTILLKIEAAVGNRPSFMQMRGKRGGGDQRRLRHERFPLRSISINTSA